MDVESAEKQPGGKLGPKVSTDTLSGCRKKNTVGRKFKDCWKVPVQPPGSQGW